MIIKYKDTKYVEFGDLFKGDFFIYKGSLYLKVAISGEKYNAFNCEDHELKGIDCLDKVKPIRIVLQEV